MGFFNDFKAFLQRGSVVDLAVGMIMGSSFNAIVTSLVNDVITPATGVFMHGERDSLQKMFILVDGSDNCTRDMTLEAAETAECNILKTGNFMMSILNFFIVAFCMFLLVRAYAKTLRPPTEKVDRDCPQCTMTIPIEATRCHHCTAKVEKEAINKQE